MKENIDKLTQLNVELEGLLHVLAKRDTDDLRELLGKKYAEFTTLFEQLLNNGVAAEDVADPLETLDRALNEDEVKDQEAVSEEVEDETQAATAALERGEKMKAEHFEPASLDFPGESAPVTVKKDGDFLMDDAEIVSVALEEDSREADDKVSDEPVAEPLALSQGVKNDEDIRVDEMLSRRGAEDLKRVFTLNDKFRFRRELFHQDDELFKQVLSKLNLMPDFDSASSYVKENFETSENEETVNDFLAIIKPHFF